MSATPLRVLVVDDSALYRKIVRAALEGIPDVEVIGVAHNGKTALERIVELKPDLLTLDIEMPELDGLGVLRGITEQKLPVGAIMCSSLTSRGAAVTTEALRLGAFDFVLKPVSESPENGLLRLKQDLTPKVNAFATASRVKRSLGSTLAVTDRTSSTPVVMPPLINSTGRPLRPDVVVIGVSTGGPAALSHVIPQLPADLAVPVLIVQHMPPLFTKSLADDLRRTSKLTVTEAADGDVIKPGQVWIAPGGKQMKVEYGGSGLVIRVTDDAPERNCKPSVDYLFRSVANCYGGKVLGVIMTGMGDDGTEGCKQLRRVGASIIAQNEATCVVYGMPRNIVENGLATATCPLDQIAPNIVRIVQNRTAALVTK